MIKLSEIVNDESKMKDFLRGRSSRDQESIFQDDKPGRPENTHTSSKYQNGYPWSFDDPSGIFETEAKKIHQALIGREFQSLEDLRKLASRLRQRGFSQQAIEQFIKSYLK